VNIGDAAGFGLAGVCNGVFFRHDLPGVVLSGERVGGQLLHVTGADQIIECLGSFLLVQGVLVDDLT